MLVLSLHALKDWWDKSNVTWFLRRQASDWHLRIQESVVEFACSRQQKTNNFIIWQSEDSTCGTLNYRKKNSSTPTIGWKFGRAFGEPIRIPSSVMNSSLLLLSASFWRGHKHSCLATGTYNLPPIGHLHDGITLLQLWPGSFRVLLSCAN